MYRLFLVLLLIYIGAVLSQYAGSVILQQLIREGTKLLLLDWSAWIGIALFLPLAFLVRNWNFQKVFIGSLGLSSLLLILAFFFRRSEIGYILSAALAAKMLPVSGWAFVNQMAPNEAWKKYFLIHVLVGVVITPLSFLGQLQISPFYLICFALTSLVWAAELGMHIKSVNQEKILEVPRFAVPSLALLFIGMQMVFVLNNSIISQKILSLASAGGPQYYISATTNSSIMTGIITLVLSLLSIWAGPMVLRSKNWSFAVLGAILSAFFGMLIAYGWNNVYMFTFYRAMLNVLHCFWFFPLVQIAFLHFNREKQFSLQILVCLVAAPLLEQLSFSFTTDTKGALLLSTVILSFMYFCSKSIDHIKTAVRQVQ